MQNQQMRQAMVRGDYSSAKLDSSGRRIDSQDSYDIETTVIEMMRQLARSKRHLGGRIAVREWIPHDVEVRFFIRNGQVLYHDSVDEFDGRPPVMQSQSVATAFDKYAWSCDFIRHSKTGNWYCIDLGLDGLYYSNEHDWVAQSEHLNKEQSPARFSDEMPSPEKFMY